MDYASTPGDSNRHLNRYDYSILVGSYTHVESTSTLAKMTASSGRCGLRRVRDDLWVEDHGAGDRRFVSVAWADRSVRHRAPEEGA